MTYTDNWGRLSGKSAGADIVQALTPTTAGVLSTDWIDLDSTPHAIGDGENLFVNFTFTVAVNSSTENATMELQIVALPKTTIAALTAFNSTDDVNDTTETITSAAHGLTDGTRVTVAAASGALPTGLAASTNYYILNATTNTFQLSLTPGGAAVGLTDAVGTTTVTWYPEIIGSSGALGIDRMGVGSQFAVRINPAPVSPLYPRNRYIFARYVPSATITAGSVYADVVLNPSSGRRYYDSGVTVV